MIGILQVASYIYKRYLDEYCVRIDEMKLHKLLFHEFNLSNTLSKKNLCSL